MEIKEFTEFAAVVASKEDKMLSELHQKIQLQILSAFCIPKNILKGEKKW